AAASPPAAVIWSTISCAGVWSEPSPLPLVPGSLTTTLAPCAAINFATSPPTPRPEPVQIATRPSSMPMMAALSRMSFGSAVDPAPAGFVNSAAAPDRSQIAVDFGEQPHQPQALRRGDV